MMQIEGLRRHDVDAFGTRIHVAEVGEGPMVLFVHGFPESWYSWRHQLPVVAAAGHRAVAIDVRGYGSSEVPEAVDAYRLVDLAADCVGVVEALGETTAVIVGHDWGAAVTWFAGLMQPGRVESIVPISIAFSPGMRLRSVRASV